MSFVTPVEAFIVQKQRDFFSLTITLKKKQTVERVIFPEGTPDDPIRPQPSKAEADPRPPPASAKPPVLAKGRLVVNLMSRTRPIDFSRIPPIPVPEGKQLYTTEAEVDGKKWYRLRFGFYSDMSAARKALKHIRRLFPKAWIDRASATEKAGVSGGELVAAPAAPAGRQKPPPRLPKRSEELPTSERLSLMMTTARDMLTAGDYPKAIRMLTAILEQPENRHTQEAIELLGLARERNGQLTHAFAEYER